MRIEVVFIDEHILDKIESKHRVTFDEAEDVVLSRASHLVRGRGSFVNAYGPTVDGRYLLVIIRRLDDARHAKIVTAREMTLSERRRFGRMRRR